MSMKCLLSFHTWQNCKCIKCGKSRDEEHSWQGCVCAICGQPRDEGHDWSRDCEKCSICGMTRDVDHDWTQDCESCSKCGKKRVQSHEYHNRKCRVCGKAQSITLDWVLSELKRAWELLDTDKDKEQYADICIALADWGVSCSEHIKKIVLNKSQDGQFRRFALKVGAGCGDGSYNSFISSNLIAGKNKAQLIAVWNTGTTDGAELGLYVTGEEILTTPDFFERYIACGYRKETSKTVA